MTRRLRGLCLLFVSALLLVATAGPAAADSLSSRGLNADADRPSPVIDAVVLRPLGILATVVGTMGFVFASPVCLVTRPQEIDEPFKALVARPAWWTWARPLGGA
jgi:hypothetical protein